MLRFLVSVGGSGAVLDGTAYWYCLHGLCAFSNMVINANIPRKSEKKTGKKNRSNVDCH